VNERDGDVRDGDAHDGDVRGEPVVVVLAAGASLRLGEPKALVDIGGRSVAAALIAEASVVFERVVVVVGAHAQAIRAHVDALGELQVGERTHGHSHGRIHVEVVVNADFARGRTGSLACAVRAAPDCDVVVAPVDVPRVGRSTFLALAAAWRAAGAPANGWLAPYVVALDGVRRFGHPIVLGRELARRVCELDPEAPLHVLRARAAPLLAVEVASTHILEDLDTPADLAELRRRADAGL